MFSLSKSQCRFILKFKKRMFTALVSMIYFVGFSGFSQVLEFEYQSQEVVVSLFLMI